MTNEQVTEMEGVLVEAQAKVEKACQLMCNEPMTDDYRREIWRAMNRALSEIETAIHQAYMLRP